MATTRKTAPKSVSKPGPKAARPKTARRKTPAAPVTGPDIAAPEPAPDADVKAPDPVAGAVESSIDDQIRRKALLDEVVQRTGAKKKDARPVIEATLEILGEAIAEGREMNLQPFGRVKYKRSKEDASNRVVVANIRQRKEPDPAAAAAQEAVAEPGD